MTLDWDYFSQICKNNNNPRDPGKFVHEFVHEKNGVWDRQKPSRSHELGAVLRGEVDDGMAQLETEPVLASHRPKILDSYNGADGGTN